MPQDAFAREDTERSGEVMTTTRKPEDLIGRDAVDLQGEKIGSVGQVYVNDVTGRPDWVTVNTGLFGLRETFAPLQGSSFDGENVVLPFEKAVVKGAPDVASANHLDTHETDELYSYYSRFMTAGFDGAWASSPDEESAGVLSGYPSEVLAQGATGTQTSDGDSMTRSEEQLRVSTERVETGRARLRKYVVTEQQTVTVPVSREEVRLVREPVSDDDIRDLDDVEISEIEREVVLHEERPVVETKTVPVEQVRLATDTVTEDRQVTAEVRKEQVEVRDETADAASRLAETDQDRPAPTNFAD